MTNPPRWIEVRHDLYVVRRDVRWTPRLDGCVLAADLAREPGGQR